MLTRRNTSDRSLSLSPLVYNVDMEKHQQQDLSVTPLLYDVEMEKYNQNQFEFNILGL